MAHIFVKYVIYDKLSRYASESDTHKNDPIFKMRKVILPHFFRLMCSYTYNFIVRDNYLLVRFIILELSLVVNNGESWFFSCFSFQPSFTIIFVYLFFISKLNTSFKTS